MPPTPLFESQRTQRRAIAGLMIGVFLCAMAAAYALTALRPGGAALASGPAPGVEPTTGLGLTDRWQRDPETERRLDLGSAQVYRDADRPTRALVVAPLAASRKVRPELVIQAALPRLMGPALLETFQPLPVPPPPDSDSDPAPDAPGAPRTLLAAELVGVSQTPDGEVAQHLIALLTTDAQTYWLLYLTDLSAPSDVEPLLESNLQTFRALHRSFTIQPRS